MDTIDTERFINEIEKRPALWDSSYEEYSNRSIKKQVWKEMVDIFGGDELLYENEKIELESSLRKKWKHLRCCFVREIRRRKNPNGRSLSSRKNPYIYFNDLLFLGNSTNDTEVAEINIEDNDTDMDDTTISNIQAPFKLQRTTPSPKKTQKSESDSKKDKKTLNKYIHNRTERENSESDEDRMFLLSLLSSFRSIPEHKKLTVKIELMKVIGKAQCNRTF